VLQLIRNRLISSRIKTYSASISKLKNAPFGMQYLKNLTEMIRENQDAVITDYLLNPTRGKVNYYFRVDIDTLDCIKNLKHIEDFLLSQNIPAGLFLRTDNETYNPADYTNIIKNINPCFEIGLHTCAYKEENPILSFKNEINEWEVLMGRKLKSFTLHGLGAYYNEAKNHFLINTKKRFNLFSDNYHSHRKYHYTIHDSHLSEHKERYIQTDFTNPPLYNLKDANIIVLIHPCYWNSEAENE